MKKNLARYASNLLGISAVVFATILKPLANSPEIPKNCASNQTRMGKRCVSYRKTVPLVIF